MMGFKIWLKRQYRGYNEQRRLQHSKGAIVAYFKRLNPMWALHGAISALQHSDVTRTAF